MSVPDVQTAAAPPSEELPPVRPPSAGFIVQLFVVPGLIVLAIVGIWLLFGKLATSEQDWRSLLIELKHPNEQRRWRAATGLSQMLTADREMGARGQKLAGNVEIADALVQTLASELERGGKREEDLRYQSFLARTLQQFDLPANVLPALALAMQPSQDREVRKNAIVAIAVLANRMHTAGLPLDERDLARELRAVAADEDPLIRQTCAYALGLLTDQSARGQLAVMLADANMETRMNAAVGLARQGDSAGLQVIVEMLRGASEPQERGSAEEFVEFLSLKAGLAAIERLAPVLSQADRGLLADLLVPLAEHYREPKIRMGARSALLALQGAAPQEQ